MGLVLSFKLNGCKGQSNEIKSLEHVQVFADIESNFRGLLSIWLESPGGMRSQLLHPRAKDNSTDGFKHWPFTSVQFWSEHPDGLWKLHIDQIVRISESDFKYICFRKALQTKEHFNPSSKILQLFIMGQVVFHYMQNRPSSIGI